MNEGPELRFDGQGAGMGTRQTGNASNATDYSLLCSCRDPVTGEKRFLNVLAALRPNDRGERSTFCTECRHATVVSDTGQIVRHGPFDLATNRWVAVAPKRPLKLVQV